MWDTPFTIGEKSSTKAKKAPEPSKPEPRTDITFKRDERPDIDYKGYKAYLYFFRQATKVQDKELSDWIISAADMNTAIQVFMVSIRNEEYYRNAVIEVEVMGIDLKTDRTSPWVMEY